MKQEDYIQLAREMFAAYPSATAFHMTSDGQAFENVNYAETHARKLDIEKRDVVSVTRADFEQVANGTEHVVTQEDLDKNPDLEEQGVKVGDVITIPGKDEE